MWSVLNERSGKSLDPLRVGLTAGSSSKAALQHLTFSLTGTILYLLLTRLSLEKDLHFSHIFTRMKKHTLITHHCCFCSNVLLCEEERLVNKSLTRWLILNCANKQSPFVKTHFLTICLRLHYIQPLSALLFLIIVSLVPSSLPHSFLCSPLVLWQEFWCCPSDLTQAKQTAEKMPLFFSPSFLLILTPFILPPLSPQTILLISSLPSSASQTDWISMTFSANVDHGTGNRRLHLVMLVGGGLHSPSAFLVINIIFYVFLEVTETTSV